MTRSSTKTRPSVPARRSIVTRTVVALVTVPLVLATTACGLWSTDQASLEASSPTPTAVLKPIAADDDGRFYGITPGPERTDQYGTYRALELSDVTFFTDLDATEVDPDVRDIATDAQLRVGAIKTATYVVDFVIDSEVAFDDSGVAQEALWARADPYFWAVSKFREHYDANRRTGSGMFVDDNFQEWKQEQGYRPAPYPSEAPRTRLQYLELEQITQNRNRPTPTVDYHFDFEYDRAVVRDTGDPATEHTSGRVTVTYQHDSEIDARIIGTTWNIRPRLGDYIEGGYDGLPEVEMLGEVRTSTVSDGFGMVLPLPDGWSSVSDVGSAEMRGMTTSSAHYPDLEVKYFDPTDPDPDVRPYLYVATYTSGLSPFETPADIAREAAGEDDEGEWFWRDGTQGGRFSMPGAEHGSVRFIPAVMTDPYDVVRISYRDAADRWHTASYFVAPGDGKKIYHDVRRSLRIENDGTSTDAP